LIPYASPAWFQNAVLYEIFVRSFADADGDGIGDFKGITERLDYLEELGVDVIWLLPIYPSPSVHGYDVSDHFGVNPEYGSLEDFQALVDAVHARGMKIILDFVPSHLSNQNPLFEDAYRNPESRYSDWFVWTNDAHTLYAGFAGNETMPRFNHYNPEVVAYLVEAALYWLDLDGDGNYSDGVDGFRVDNVTFPPQEFFVTLRQEIKAVNPDALLLGESWVHTPSDLSRFFQDQFDALFDFPLYELLQGNQDSNGDGLLANKGFPALLTILLEEEAERYPEQAIAVRFLSNHDTNRIATELAGDPDRQRLAAALLAAFPGPVMVYYGDEIGMLGQKGGPPHWDNYRREPMDWYAGEDGLGQTTWFQPEDRWNKPGDGISVEEQESDPGSLLNFYRQSLNTRQSNIALGEGDFSLLEMEVSGQGPWGFVRSAGSDTVVALFNFADEERQVTINEFPFTATVLADLLSGEEYHPGEEGQPYELTLPPAAAFWLSGE
jgi:glycosidase